MKNKLVFIIFSLISLSIHAQLNEYVVFTFESKRSIDKEFQKYYWIAHKDSIKDTDFRIYPLYLIVGEFSKDNLDNCQKGDSIDIFVSTDKTNLDFDKDYESNVEDLISLIDNNRIKIQSIDISWAENKKAKNKINIYATPIRGNFCNCFQYHNLGTNKFNSFIYLPIGNFSYIKSFWDTPTASIVKYSDYSSIDYKTHFLHKKGVQYVSE
ncbi:MAG: hypothetical protein LBI82_13225 [Dysgonamonadaceae bacterium]|jgi:hypothetical protein|nr:hypothetical protein [Dysgonamonadaceae bacterium]